MLIGQDGMIKIAAYCRVSTDKRDQVNSLVSQQRYFKEYIDRNPQWQLYDIYADEGVTGTSTCKRSEFKRMMQDARRKCFHLIITKEVSRFSRNILDTITCTRELKSLGIGVVFLNDGLNTLVPDSELRLSIMGSIAQEESRKTSERVKWGQLRQMERGVVFGRSLLGYDLSGGILCINPEGAEIVRRIFYQYGIEKKSISTIARELRWDQVKTASGNSVWRESYILKILKNEKYVGDLVQKKTITPDYLTHLKKYNHGEESLIVIGNHHEPIISRDLWETVQKEIILRQRKHMSKSTSNKYPLSGKIICAECGATFVARSKTRRNGSSYRYWSCLKAAREGRKKIDSYGNMTGCDVGKHIRDDLAMDMLRFVILELNADWEAITDNITTIITEVFHNSSKMELLISKLKQKEYTLQRKKASAIDAFLSGIITEEEMLQMKSMYDEALNAVKRQLFRQEDKSKESIEIACIKEFGNAIISGKTEADRFCGRLLEYIKVYRDGTVQIKLNKLNTIWKFELTNKNGNSI